MDSLELDRDQALVSLENSLRRVIRTGIGEPELTEFIAQAITHEQRRLRVAKLREKGAKK